MEAKQIADAAEAARVYLERTNASVDTVNRAAEIRLLAERQMGEFLKHMPKATGMLKQGPAVPERNHGSEPATLREIGITKKQSATAQKLAEIPADEFSDRVAVAKIDGKLSIHISTRWRRAQRARLALSASRAAHGRLAEAWRLHAQAMVYLPSGWICLTLPLRKSHSASQLWCSSPCISPTPTHT